MHLLQISNLKVDFVRFSIIHYFHLLLEIVGRVILLFQNLLKCCYNYNLMHGKLIYNDRAWEIVVYNLHVEMYLFTDIITHIDTLRA